MVPRLSILHRHAAFGDDSIIDDDSVDEKKQQKMLYLKSIDLSRLIYYSTNYSIYTTFNGIVMDIIKYPRRTIIPINWTFKIMVLKNKLIGAY